MVDIDKPASLLHHVINYCSPGPVFSTNLDVTISACNCGKNFYIL